MKRRLIFFRGLIATLDLYTEEFVKIFTAHGAECLVLDAAHMDGEMLRLKAFLLSEVTAAISCNNIGLHLEFEDGKNIWDRFQIPFYNIMMDHPFHYKNALDAAPEQMALLCMDRNHIAYAKRFFPHIRTVAFFPHAGIAVPGYAPTGRAASGTGKCPISGRGIDVIYAGGLSRYTAEGLIPDLGKVTEFDAFLLVRNALERLVQEPELTTEYVIEQCLKDMGIVFDDKKLGELIAELRFLDSFAVSFYREQAMRLLTDHGIQVTVFGSGWEHCEWESPNLVLGGVVRPAQVLEFMSQSKVVLNIMTWFKRGAHDRVFNGMLAGAAVVSDTSEYMQECFHDGRELRLFSLRGIQSLPEIVGELLADPQEAQHLADAGYEAAKKGHMWENRFHAIGLL